MTASSTHGRGLSFFLAALLLILLLLLIHPLSVQGGRMRIFLKGGRVNQASSPLFLSLSVTVHFRVDGRTAYLESREIQDDNTPTWNSWLSFAEQDIPASGTLQIKVVTTFRPIIESQKTSETTTQYSFAGCSPQSTDLNSSLQDATIDFTLEYTPTNLCNTSYCDAATTSTCSCLEDNSASCTCKLGYSPVSNNDTHCQEGKLCEDNENDCDASSTSCRKIGSGTVVCDCLSGYERVTSTTCTPINVCATTPDVCGSNSFCSFVGPATYICTCAEGYKSNSTDGTNCVAIDRCAPGTSICDDHSICRSHGPGNYTCTPCPDGHQAKDDECVAIDPCTAQSSLCGDNAVCEFTGPNQHTCLCNEGYEQESGSSECTPIDACKGENPCGNHSLCTATGPGTYTCECEDGYASIFDDQQDCMPIDLCETDNGGCGPNSTCDFAGPGTRTCTCKPGYRSNSNNGTDCTEIDPCTAEDYGGCNDATQECVHVGPNENECYCLEGLQFNDNTGACEQFLTTTATVRELATHSATHNAAISTTANIGSIDTPQSTASAATTVNSPPSTTITTTSTTPASSSSSSSNSAVSPAVIAAVTGGTIAGLALLISALVLLARQRKRRAVSKRALSSRPHNVTKVNPAFDATELGTVEPTWMPHEEQVTIQYDNDGSEAQHAYEKPQGLKRVYEEPRSTSTALHSQTTEYMEPVPRSQPGLADLQYQQRWARKRKETAEYMTPVPAASIRSTAPVPLVVSQMRRQLTQAKAICDPVSLSVPPREPEKQGGYDVPKATARHYLHACPGSRPPEQNSHADVVVHSSV